MTILATHRERVEQASRVLAEGRKALLRPDGTRKYSDAEHAERELILRRGFDQTMAEAGEAAQTVTSEAQAELDRVAPDPAHTLTTDELQRATLLLPLLERDAESLTPIELARRAEAGLESGKGDRYAWSKLIDRRSRELRDTIQSGRLPPGDPAFRRGTATLETIAERLLGSLVDLDARSRAEEQAREQQREASSLGGAVAVNSYLEREYGPRPVGWKGY